MNSHLKGGLLIILSMVVFSTQVIFARFISLDILPLLAYAQIFYMLILLIYMLGWKRETFRINEYKWIMILAGLIWIANQVTYFLSLRLTSAANATLTHYTAPIFAFILAVLLLREKFQWQSLAAIAVSTAGIVLITSGVDLGSEHWIGILLGLASGLCYGILMIVIKIIVQKNPVVTCMFYQGIAALLVLIPFTSQQLPTVADLGYIAALVLGPYLIGVVLYFLGVRYVEGQHIGIIAYVEIFFIILIGYLFFSEIPPAQSWLGGFLIVASGMWIIYQESGNKSSKTAS